MSSWKKTDSFDPNLRSLVADIESKPEEQIPKILSKLQDILGIKSVQDSKEFETFKQDLYNHGILQYCAAGLKINFAKVKGGFSAAAQLADILSSCCVGLMPVRNQEVFLQELLPLCADGLLSLANRLRQRAMGEGRAKMMCLFKKVMFSLCWLLRGHIHLVPHVLQSRHYEQIQMCDEEEVAAVCLSVWHDLLKTESSFVGDLGNGFLGVLLDDVVFRMANSSNPVIGAAAVKTLFLIGQQNCSALQLILNKFRGLDDLVEKDWRGKGFDVDLDQLINLLHTEMAKPTDLQDQSEERNHAACVLQAAWRANQTRRRIRTLPRAVSILQRSFRERRRCLEEQTQRRRTEEELRHVLCLRRQRAIREFRQRQLHLLEILPAGQVERYLGEVERRAALTIQRAWRGYRERRRFHHRRHAHKQNKAAVTIQRAILCFLKRRRGAKVPPSPWIGPSGLTDSRRTELKKQVEEHIALHPSSVLSLEGCVELHEQTQELLLLHAQGRQADRAAETHRLALMAQINTDLELLLNTPSLIDATVMDRDVFLSRSAPVAARARQSHNALLQSFRLPWWRVLGEEFSHPEFSQSDELEAEFGSLYIGGKG